jgi:hypothetical protein
MKTTFTLILSLLLAFHISGCTSQKTEDGSETQEIADETTSEISDVAGETESTEGTEGTEGEESSSDFGSDETVAADDGSEAVDPLPAEDGANQETKSSDTTAESDPFAEQPPAEENKQVADAAPSEGNELDQDFGSDSEWATADTTNSLTDGSTTAETTPPADEKPTSVFNPDELGGSGQTSSGDMASTDTGTPSEASSLTDVAPVAASGSLKKMVTTPYMKSGILLNALYVARKGDTMKSISNKIYGTNKVADLKAANPHLASRKPVVGDKVYYNSPQRPTDKSQVLVYYEDLGLSPETYVAQDGDSIRTVSERLLGDSKSWKEIWATNLDVESKDTLVAGTQLRYWTGDGAPTDVAAPPVAMGSTDLPPAPPVENYPPPQQAIAQEPPPPVAEAVPPPPPPQNFAIQEPPPPPPPAAPKVETPPASTNPLDAITSGGDTTALIAGAILLLAAVFMVILIRKKKSRKNIDFQTATHTQME